METSAIVIMRRRSRVENVCGVVGTVRDTRHVSDAPIASATVNWLRIARSGPSRMRAMRVAVGATRAIDDLAVVWTDRVGWIVEVA